MVIRRMSHHKPGGLRPVGPPRRTAPLAHALRRPWAVLIARLPGTVAPQCGVGYPAGLRHRLHPNEPLAWPGWCWHPRPRVHPGPEHIMARVLLHLGLIAIHCRTHALV